MVKKMRRSGRVRAATASAPLCLALFVASVSLANEQDPVFAGLVPGEPLAEEDLVLFEGKGSVTSNVLQAVTGAMGASGARMPRHEQAEARADATVERMQEVEDRLERSRTEAGAGGSLGAAGAVGVAGGGLSARDAERRMSDRLDRLVDRSFASETRTHWTIWH
jgi:hypothetical protein